jgi:hypothetical protein
MVLNEAAALEAGFIINKHLPAAKRHITRVPNEYD